MNNQPGEEVKVRLSQILLATKPNNICYPDQPSTRCVVRSFNSRLTGPRCRPPDALVLPRCNSLGKIGSGICLFYLKARENSVYLGSTKIYIRKQKIFCFENTILIETLL